MLLINKNKKGVRRNLEILQLKSTNSARKLVQKMTYFSRFDVFHAYIIKQILKAKNVYRIIVIEFSH
jgi:tRNA isopentenyl-2-thiomethyl-A-37 hydroxylase MiaE